MSEKQKLPNPFETARPLGGVSVMIKPEDIMDACPGWSEATIEKVLRQNAAVIAARMFSAGVEAAAQIINGDGGDA